tara:strand:- start:347 stop:634 length:288 start_codon:yes stop_codon:yes gene_type:complete
MKKLILFSIILIVGCDLFESEDQLTGWICKLKTECFSPIDSTIIDCPLPRPSPNVIDTITIFNSFEGCDSKCVKSSSTLQIDFDINSPYYCKETN